MFISCSIEEKIRVDAKKRLVSKKKRREGERKKYER